VQVKGDQVKMFAKMKIRKCPLKLVAPGEQK
jgi:hypothetical protein